MFWFIVGGLAFVGVLICTLVYFGLKELERAYKETMEDGWENPFR